MPSLNTHDISLAFDMHGCPSACRHCWLGGSSRRRLDERDVRSIVTAFREWRRPGEADPFFRKLTVDTWVWEPDFPDTYRELNDLGNELSTDGTSRYELLSIWRLARDESYAPWAYDVGTRICQITFFGMEETSDWFIRRRGAFRDSILATEQLLEAGIVPRWQFFLTRRILPELNELMGLIDSLRLRERVADLGGEFDVFLHTPGPDGNAGSIEGLRPTIDELEGAVPQDLLDSTARHFGEIPWRPEEDLCRLILGEEPEATAYAVPGNPYFVFMGSVRNEPDAIEVYPNIGDMSPWWRLGDMRIDSVTDVIERHESDACPGLKANFHTSAAELVERYGRRGSRTVYDSTGNLLKRYLAVHMAAEWSARKNQR